MTKPKIVSQQEWIDARKSLLAKEKNLTRLHDELAAERRQLPWTRVEKNYTFDAPHGKVSLSDLFGGHSQLFVYHFMFGPDWKEGCPSCSYVCDHLNGAVPHLAARDVSLTMISRAPLPKIEAFKKRMGWQFPWVSSSANDFNHYFGVYFTPDEMAKGKVAYNYTMQPFPNPEAPGASIFYKDESGKIFHTNSIYGRGLDQFVTTYTLLDLVPKGRDEDSLPFSMSWVRHHDKYATGELLDKDRPYWPKIAAK
jgi:predicted dithiol-disulfide oxidoreductase (DUF899 family)